MDTNPERAVELANEAISAFTSRFQEHWLAGMRDKLGLSGNEEGDIALVRELLQAMHENAADFTLTFRRLCDAAADEKADANVRSLFTDPAAYDSWAARWRSRLVVETLEPNARAQAMRTVNPAFIPRNHRVEQALGAAIEHGDFSPFAELLTVLSRPYEIKPPSPTMPTRLKQMSASSGHSAGLDLGFDARSRLESPPIKIAPRTTTARCDQRRAGISMKWP